MKLGSMKYLTGEGFKNAWANRLMSLASIGVLVACMVVIGLALLISKNVNVAIGNLEEQNVVMVYMKDYNWALYSEDSSDDESSEETTSETASQTTEEAEENTEETTDSSDSKTDDAQNGETDEDETQSEAVKRKNPTKTVF